MLNVCKIIYFSLCRYGHETDDFQECPQLSNNPGVNLQVRYYHLLSCISLKPCICCLFTLWQHSAPEVLHLILSAVGSAITSSRWVALKHLSMILVVQLHWACTNETYRNAVAITCNTNCMVSVIRSLVYLSKSAHVFGDSSLILLLKCWVQSLVMLSSWQEVVIWD